MKADGNQDLTYEEAIKKLESIVKRLEDADIPLEESLSSFQEGIALSRYCREKLAEIEYRVEHLLKGDRGEDACDNMVNKPEQADGDPSEEEGSQDL